MDLTDDQASTYRQAVTAKWPSLPRRAGKAYAKFTKVITRLEATPPPPKRTPGRRRKKKLYVVRTEGVVRPDVDFDKLARVLLVIARDKAEKKKAAQLTALPRAAASERLPLSSTIWSVHS